MHPSTDIWLCAWAFDDMDVPELWQRGERVPQRIIDHVISGGEIRAHNAAFERLIWKYIATPRYGWPEAKLEQFVCSAAEAAAMALPRSLGKLAEVTKLPVQKDMAGYNEMLRMCRPRKVLEDGTLVWWDVPERIVRLGEYCIDDVRTERAATKVLRRLNAKEREIYLLTERMNDEGIQVDLELIAAAKMLAESEIQRANDIIMSITKGTVSGVTKVAQLTKWINEQGVAAESIAKAPLRDLLDGQLPEDVRLLLQIRADAGKSSVAKLDSILQCVCPDGRIRGTLLYHGAGTGRWTGKGVQPHNFPRGEVEDVESYIPLVMAQKAKQIAKNASPLLVVSAMLRSMLTAKEGHELISADYSAIEARVLNWLAGQDDIVQLFASGEDVYKHNAVKLYGIPMEEVQKFPHRQTGKFQELGCGFQMGAKKAVSAAKDVYQLEIDEVRAKEIVDGYRETHPAVVQSWYEANHAVLAAVARPGVPYKFGARQNLIAIQSGPYLYIVLPNKRMLAYPAPRLKMHPTPWGELRQAVEFYGVNGLTKQWEPDTLYGGLIMENVTQAVARDLMAEGKLRLETRGYTPILSVHDEVVSEVPVGFGSVEEYEQILCELPEWAAGCPVAAEGWRGFRYRK